MVCRSASVERAAARSNKAQQALLEFAGKNKAAAVAYEAEFRKKITSELERAGVTDQKFPLATGIEQHTEYASEFNVDKITGVVKDALHSLQEVSKEGAPTVETATSPEAFDSYVQVVQSIGASLKSSSETSSSFTFQMTKIGPGIFAFISAQSANLTDVETFGEEAVNSLTFVYTFARSIQDIENTNGYEAAKNAAEQIAIIRAKTLVESAKIASETIIELKKAQAALINAVISGKYNAKQYDELDHEYQKVINIWEARQNGRSGSALLTNLALQKHTMEELDSVLLRKLKALTTSPRSDARGVAMKVLERVHERRAAAKPDFSVADYLLTASSPYTIVRNYGGLPGFSQSEQEKFNLWQNAVVAGTDPRQAAMNLGTGGDFKKLTGVQPTTYQFRVSNAGRVRFQLDEVNRICTITYASSRHPKLLADDSE